MIVSLFRGTIMNEIFLTRMQSLLKEEYEAYVETLQMPAYKGIRKNTLKESGSLLEDTFSLSPSLFCKEGYYVEETISGNHPFHLQGLFYMQEPSASSAVSVLDVQQGDWVLDLCAAPGGKSTQIAAALGHTGLLVSNEIVSNRASILLSNLERMGASENIIVNASPEQICKDMQGCFDKVLVDAPCSGEGMFKKHEKAMEDWSEEHVLACANRQLCILKDAYKALKKDGILVYSTCTYAIEENEQVVHAFLEAFPQMELVDCGVDFGRKGYPYKEVDVQKVRRIFPMDKGEGHFIAKFKKNEEEPRASLQELRSDTLPSFVNEWMDTQLGAPLAYAYVHNDKVYMKNTPFLKLKKSKILRQGILCGEIVKQRFEPHHHFYMASYLDTQRKNTVGLNEDECKIFLSGNVVPKECPKGYVCVTYYGHPIGFGKSDGKVIKNKLPKGLRVLR